MGSKVTKSTTRRRGRKLLVLGLIGLGAAVFRATRQQAAPAPTPAPAPAPAPSPVEPVTEAVSEVVPAPEPLPEPVLETEPQTAPEAAVAEPEPEAVSGAAELHDIVEEPWGDAEVTPATEPPADSLSSFFDEVMTDTAERKLRKGRSSNGGA